ncbi:MAG: hypothetical protein U0790_13440 [Isosphaeraceae bacterium]
MNHGSELTRRSFCTGVTAGIAVVVMRAVAGCAPSGGPVDPSDFKKSAKYKDLHPEEYGTPVKKKVRKQSR